MKNRKFVLVIAILTVAVMLMFSFAACKDEITEDAGLSDSIYNINGYQVAPSAEQLKAITKPGKEIVPISTMLEETGLKLNSKKDQTAIAANIYHMIVRNANNITSSGYQVATNASVNANKITANLPVLGEQKIDTFDVGLRSTYSEMYDKGAKFSQTISGVTILDISGWMNGAGKIIKGMFGYNIQSFGNEDFDAFRRDSNGGATFFNLDGKPEIGNKMILGASRKKNPNDSFPNKISKGSKDGTGEFRVTKKEATASADAANVADDKPIWAELERKPWTDSVIKGEYPSGGSYEYALGNMGCSWALYNFNADWLDPDETVVQYDKENKMYTVKIVVKRGKEYAEKACEFAKSTLIKDTISYILLNEPYYDELTNVIRVHECGLISSWVRHELLKSDANDEHPSYLTVFTGGWPKASDVAYGGSTGNDSISVFSYDERDYNPYRMAALYWSQLGDSKVMSKAGVDALDLSKYPSFEEYEPVINNK